MNLTETQPIRICRCGHLKAFHEHDRRGTDCGRCVCTAHKTDDEYPLAFRVCAMYPEECRGLCWSFRDQRSVFIRLLDFLRRS